jgi:hypothetical protein
MAIIAPDHMLDERSSDKYLREIAPVDPTATRFASEKMLGLVDRLHADALADDGAARNRRCHARNLGSARIPDFGTAPLRLLATGFGYLNFLGRSCREPFGGDQNSSICLLSKQSEQLRLFLVGLRKR